jgi:hypothetical protein
LHLGEGRLTKKFCGPIQIIECRKTTTGKITKVM